MTFAGGSSARPLGSFGAKPAKKPKDPWGPNILHNLAKDIEEFATGIPASVGYIGRAVGSDAKELVGLGDGAFELDDLAKDIVRTSWDDITTRWTPLFRGDLKEFWKQIDSNPLAFGLDGATLLSGGAAGAAKAGKAAIRVGDSSGLLARSTGLTKTARKVDVGDATAIQQIRTLGGEVDNLGNVWDGPVGKLVVNGKDQLEIPLSSNPYIRAKQKAGLKISNRMQTAPMVGSAARIAKRQRKGIDQEVMRNSITRTALADDLYKSLDDIDTRASHLMGFAQAGIKRSSIVAFYEKRAANIEKTLAEQGDNVDPRTVMAKEHVDGRLRDLNDEEAWMLAENPDAWSDNLRAFAKENSDLSRETSRMLWQAAGETYRGRPVSFDDYYDLQTMRERRFIDDPELDELLDDDQIDIGDLIEANRKLGGKGEFAYVRPHLSPKEIAYSKRDMAEVGLQVGGVATNPKLKRSMKNNMLLFADAMDALTPASVVEAARDAARFEGELMKLDALLGSAVKVEALGKPPVGHVRIKTDNMAERVRITSQWLESEAKVVYGDGPELQGVQQRFRDLSAAMEQGDLYAPKIMVDELARSSRDWGRMIRALDSTTSAWRTMTLTARPVWITSNVVGALTLLSVSHGLIRSAAGIFAALKHGGKGPIALDRFAPDVAAAGWMRTALDEVRGGLHVGSTGEGAMHLANKSWSALQKLQEKILYVNSVISDDIPRRAAFYAEIKPHVKKIMQAEGIDFEQAALKYLADPKVVDKVADKVLDDLVNFRDLSHFEREYVRRLLPFVSWVKGSTSRAWRLYAEEPQKVSAAFYLNEYAQDRMQEEYGDLPDYLRGFIGLGKGEDGAENIIATKSLNPFGTVGEIAGIAQSTLLGSPKVGSSNPAAMMGPVPKSILEAAANRNLFYGTDLDPTNTMSYAERFARQFLQAFPQKALADKLTGDLSSKPQGYEPLYQNDPMDLLLSYFALPVKSLNVKEANRRAAEEAANIAAPVI